VNPYEVLEIQPGASLEEIKRAYRRMALKYHPDRVPPEHKAEAEERFKEIVIAYQMLTNNEIINRVPTEGKSLQEIVFEIGLLVLVGVFENLVKREKERFR
jgi:DnaJ family protein C protein 9